MKLLKWCQLSPEPEQNGLSAILFPSPVRIYSIRIFPTGSQPFAQAPDIIAETKPDAFFLEIFFNIILPSSSPDVTRVSKNALAPTSIAYTGGQAEYSMNPEFSTRLVILKGSFETISLALYGEVVTNTEKVRDEYSISKSLPLVEPSPLPMSVDPGNSNEPWALAEKLLGLLPVVPSLSLVTRLIFCLKPQSEDWDEPNFPYLYVNLDEEVDFPSIQSVVELLCRPIQEDITAETFIKFAETVDTLIASKTPDDAFFFAKLLSILSSQQPLMSRILLQHVDLLSIFNEQTLRPDDSQDTVLLLVDAAASLEIARYFLEDKPFYASLSDLHLNSKLPLPVRHAIQRLQTRIDGWKAFTSALDDVEPDLVQSVAFLKDLASEEHSLGCWLVSMLNHDELCTKFDTQLLTPSANPRSLPRPLFRHQDPEMDHSDFIVFVKALLGLASVIAVWSWSDSIGIDSCRERALAILALWDEAEGYREILNHCMMLRQLTKRLNWIAGEKDPPIKSGILAERLLIKLSRDPQAMLQEHLYKIVRQLEEPFCFIESEEIMEMRKLANVSYDGLPSAVEELAFSSDRRPFSLRRLRVLRLSLAIISQELEKDVELDVLLQQSPAGDEVSGEEESPSSLTQTHEGPQLATGDWKVLRAFWVEWSQGCIPGLVSLLRDITEDLNEHFTVRNVPKVNQSLADLLFCTAEDLLRLIPQFVTKYNIVNRDLKTLTCALSGLYACGDLAMLRFSQISQARANARRTTHICEIVLRDLIKPMGFNDALAPRAICVMSSLLGHARSASGRDPVHHISQVYQLVTRVVPDKELDDDTEEWVLSVLPAVLTEMTTLFHSLHPERQHELLSTLVGLDDGQTGIGQWLLQDALHALQEILQTVVTKFEDDAQLAHHRIFLLLHALEMFTSPDSSISSWTIQSLSSNADISTLLENCLSLILEQNYMALPLTRFIRHLAESAQAFGPDVRFNIILLLLRIAQTDPSMDSALEYVVDILVSLPPTSIIVESLRNEIGRTLATLAEYSTTITPSSTQQIIDILDWLAQRTEVKLTTLTGVTREAFSRLCGALGIDASSGYPSLTVDEDEVFTTLSTELPETLSLPLRSIENMFSSKPGATPSTPKGTKTPDILGVVISPPTSILRSPAATGLTKTYLNDEFRQLRQSAVSRLNTSRLPSTHGQFHISSFHTVLTLRAFGSFPRLHYYTIVDDFDPSLQVAQQGGDLLPPFAMESTAAVMGLPFPAYLPGGGI
ncbi:hypothetical protein CVT24_002143 [Panaeolus cyanescens]|uniref:Virilizer N-terminal domain-containing protein n=1 Tax=Panaeolus cyanescens TaxID=181874 RepID=A0A409YI48_9AGAR|nr:hypothetical protein CVT24_002143 [Panaeolus cyanescens]